MLKKKQVLQYCIVPTIYKALSLVHLEAGKQAFIYEVKPTFQTVQNDNCKQYNNN